MSIPVALTLTGVVVFFLALATWFFSIHITESYDTEDRGLKIAAVLLFLGPALIIAAIWAAVFV